MHSRIQLIENIKPSLKKLANPCRLCIHKCSVDRAKGEAGFCRATAKPAVYSYSPHYGEEPPLSMPTGRPACPVGRQPGPGGGSGTIFFTHCNMKCIYCQNYAFSQETDFEEIETEELAQRMLELQRQGCYNINLVSPTHYAYQIVESLQIAIKKSLNIPIVYNTGGYDNIELIKLLDGIVDIYLPDMRYCRDAMALKYSSAKDYTANNRLIIKEMFRQVGILKLNREGVAKKGMIVRLLILPNNISGIIETLKFLKEEVSKDIYLSVMSQYHPTYKAEEYPEMARRINKKEYKEVIDEVEKLGFTNGWIQGFITEPGHFLGTNIKPKSLDKRRAF
ncbi:MAG: radical SAM protein [Candidatus Omnitrophota bacterium]|nr:MAG: radical SAM protein [Candidatus Omnitrophota bacterium]